MLPWEERNKRNKNPDFGKEKRNSMIDKIINDSKKPEKSTPGPCQYKYEKLKILPSLKNGISGGAAL